MSNPPSQLTSNIRLAYIIAFLNKSWFWVGIWILFYLRFTNYTGIGVIESTMIILSVLFEIPTGAISDLLGRKKTLIASMLFWAAGNIIMAFSPNFSILVFSVVFMTIGGALYSGTFEALVYDTLKEHNKESIYDKVISNITSLDSIAMAVCSIAGGFMYVIDPRLPFIASGIGYFIGAIVALFLKEPSIDSEKFSLNNFVKQNKAGFKELFQDTNHTMLILFVLPLMAVYVFGYQFLQDAIHLDLGFKEEHLGIIVAGICIVAAAASQLTRLVEKRISFEWITIISSLIAGCIYIILGFISPILAIVFSYLRIGILTIQYNLTSQKINNIVSSKNRATALSTFSLLTNLPYVLTAFFMGKIIDSYSALTFAYYLGIGTVIIAVYQFIVYIFSKKL